MNAVIAFVRFVDRFNYYLGRYLVSWILFVIMGIALFEVVTRRIIGTPHAWTQEMLVYFFCAHFVLALGYTLYHKEHVVVDVFTTMLPERAQVILETLVYVVFIGAFVYVMIPTAIEFAARSWASGERAPTAFNSPVYPAKTLIPISIILLAVQLAGLVGKNVLFLVRGKPIEDA